MKIAYFVRQFPALSETFVLNQITGLIDLGHSVDIFALASKNEDKIHPDVEKYHLLDRTTYVKIPKERFQRGLNALKILIKKSYKNPKVYLNAINPFKNGMLAASLKLLHMASYFDKPYDILHCHFGPIGNMGIMLKLIEAPIKKYITTFHAADLTVFFNCNDISAYSELFDACDLMLPISYRWKKKLEELGCDRNKIIVHRMGVNCKLFKYKERIFPKHGNIKLISVVRLTEKKGLKYSIQALSRLIHQFKNVEYNIIGEGSLKNELIELIKNLNLNNNVHLLGQKSQVEVCNLLDQSHILIAPSVTAEDGDQEGIPVALMEAMAMGLPVISTQHSGIPELIENGVSGLLVAERDKKALVKAISFLLRNPRKWAQYGLNGRKRIEEEYEIHKLNKKLEAKFSELLSNGSD
jgi:colanic acid/amylovoran biosynthesis glycosyltransferase